jgi:hypothetical protein
MVSCVIERGERVWQCVNLIIARTRRAATKRTKRSQQTIAPGGRAREGCRSKIEPSEQSAWSMASLRSLQQAFCSSCARMTTPHIATRLWHTREQSSSSTVGDEKKGTLTVSPEGRSHYKQSAMRSYSHFRRQCREGGQFHVANQVSRDDWASMKSGRPTRDMQRDRDS